MRRGPREIDLRAVLRFEAREGRVRDEMGDGEGQGETPGVHPGRGEAVAVAVTAAARLLLVGPGGLEFIQELAREVTFEFTAAPLAGLRPRECVCA